MQLRHLLEVEPLRSMPRRSIGTSAIALVQSAKGEQIVQSLGADTDLAEIGLHLKQ